MELKVSLSEEDVLDALGKYVRELFPFIDSRQLLIEVKVVRGVYSATVETEKVKK